MKKIKNFLLHLNPYVYAVACLIVGAILLVVIFYNSFPKMTPAQLNMSERLAVRYLGTAGSDSTIASFDIPEEYKVSITSAGVLVESKEAIGGVLAKMDSNNKVSLSYDEQNHRRFYYAFMISLYIILTIIIISSIVIEVVRRRKKKEEEQEEKDFQMSTK